MNIREFPLTALYGAACDGYVSGLVEFCALLHRRKVYVFKLSIPLASCSYATCISAGIVPG